MRRIITFALVLAFIGVLVPAFIPYPVYAMTGSGTSGDPYMIYDVDDLQDMANNLTAYYELANGIDASATSGWNGGAGFVPVGTWVSPFTGHFDGNGYTISGLFINRPSTDDVGLFGSIQALNSGTTVQNVTMTGADITGDDNTGAFAGTARGRDTSPYYTLTLDSVAVLNSEVDGNGASTGGVIGALWGIADVSYCYYTGTVYGSGFKVGGLVGYQLKGTSLYRCGTVVVVEQDGWGSRVGGLVGQSQCDIEECYSYGIVSNTGADPDAAYEGVGGLVGKYDPVVQDYADILNCYSRCSVTGKIGTYGEKVAGLVGIHVGTYSDIINSYSTGLVSGGLTRGGLTTHSSSDCYDCFWDIQTSGQSSSACGTGKTTSQMKTESTFTDAGWNFTTIWGIGGAVNDGYPYFDWWYNPFEWDDYDFYQVLWFQPNAIIEGTTLPDRAGTEDGIITWGANPAGISISYSGFEIEETYEFEPVIPSNRDIIRPEPAEITTDVSLERLENNPFRPLVQAIASVGGFTERLVWLGLAWFVLIAAMLLVHLGPDTREGDQRPHHFILTSGTGLGLAILFYSMGIFPLWVPILLTFGFGASIVYERMPVL